MRQKVFGDEEDASLEDVVTAYVMTVLSEVVYIAPVPAVIAAPALAALQHLRHRTSPCRDRSICASGGILCASSCSVDELFQVAAQSGVQHVEWGHEAVCEHREGLARLPERLRAIESSVAAVSNFVDQQREAGIDARLKTVDVFFANANPPLDTTSAQERFQADEDAVIDLSNRVDMISEGEEECLIAFENAFTAMHESLQQRGILPPGTVPLTEEEE